MKIQVNGKDVYELNETKLKVLCNDLCSETLLEDIERRVRYIIEHKYKQCFKRLRAEWEIRFIEKGMAYLPTNEDEFAEMVFQQEEYKDRSARDLEEKQV